MRIDPAMCECDWLMIVMACACWLGEECGYGWVCVWVCMRVGMGVGVRGGGLEGYVFCCYHLYYGVSFLTFFLIQYVCLLIEYLAEMALMLP